MENKQINFWSDNENATHEHSLDLFPIKRRMITYNELSNILPAQFVLALSCASKHTVSQIISLFYLPNANMSRLALAVT